MNKKDWVYCSIIAVLLVLWGVSNIEITEIEPRKERNETYLGDCEIWEICDYRSSECISITCPSTYKCWEKRKNCTYDIESIWPKWFKW